MKVNLFYFKGYFTTDGSIHYIAICSLHFSMSHLIWFLPWDLEACKTSAPLTLCIYARNKGLEKAIMRIKELSMVSLTEI